MTLALQADHTYRARNGETFGPLRPYDHPLYVWGALDDSGRQQCWTSDGRWVTYVEHPLDLVEDITALAPAFDPAGPVRQETVTRTKIVYGVHGRLYVVDVAPTTHGVALRFTRRDTAEGVGSGFWLNAEELDQLAATATQLAAALRAIALETQS